jgi:hypothetical protein
MSRHELLGGLIQVYRRGGRHWHCSASIEGRQYRATTGEDDSSSPSSSRRTGTSRSVVNPKRASSRRTKRPSIRRPNSF